MTHQPTNSASAPRATGAGRFGRLSALELAAERGIGPLSPLAAEAWHGRAQPCVSCGELILRTDVTCPHCGQNHSLQMITKMQAHCGPWYVHEHVRPFPGVSLERLIRQARRGNLTATTIVRGPTTYHQWRFAAETPGLSKYVGKCWNCQATVAENATYCHTCDVHLDRPVGEPAEEGAAPAESTESELQRLTMALRSTPRPAEGEAPERAAPAVANESRAIRIPVTIVIAILMVLAIVALLAVVRLRERSVQPLPPPGPAAALISQLPIPPVR